jgi:hypothetical protein
MSLVAAWHSLGAAGLLRVREPAPPARATGFRFVARPGIKGPGEVA